MHKFLRVPQVIALVGIPRSSIYARMAAGTFPKNVSLGERAVVWLEADIQDWMQARVEAAIAKRG